MSIKGWTKMDECSWRHDGCYFNKLNVNVKDPEEIRDIGEHASTFEGRSSEGYLLVYNVVDPQSHDYTGRYVLSEHTTKEEANRAAAEVMRDNYDTIPFKDD